MKTKVMTQNLGRKFVTTLVTVNDLHIGWISSSKLVVHPTLKCTHFCLGRTTDMPARKHEPFKRKWTDEVMKAAVASVLSGQLSYRQAALQYDIPRSTIRDHASGKSQPGIRRGQQPILKLEEEEALVEWSIKMAEIGYGRTKEELKDTVKKILDRQGRKVSIFKNNRPGKDWFYLFLRRHPELTERKPESLQISRAIACSENKVMAWFKGFEALLKENGIDSPSQIANVDETGCPFQPGSTGKIVVAKGISNAYQISSPSKEQITTLVCGFANGTVLPPYHVYPGQRINAQWTQDCVDDAYFGVTSKGWMETEAFYSWIVNRFLKQIPPIRPIVLLLDGHESHIDMYTSKVCQENNILLYCLPPHCSHILQPLDVGFFHPLKVQWRKACKEFSEKNPGVTVNKMNFSRVFKSAWEKTVTMGNVISSFAKSGIWPVDPSRINKESFAPSTIYKEMPQTAQATSEKENIPPLVDCANRGPDAANSDMTALQVFEKALSESQVALYRRRINEGFDLGKDKDPVYEVYKNVVAADVTSQVSTSTTAYGMAKARRQLSFPNDGPMNVSESVKVCSEILTYPGVTKKKERKRSVKQSLPRHLSSREAILLMEAEIARKKKEDDKKKRLKERKRKKEEKEKKANEKNEKKKQDQNKRRKSGREPKKVWRCAECEGIWTDKNDEEELWIACDNCLRWFHVECTGLVATDDLDLEDIEFFCGYC